MLDGIPVWPLHLSSSFSFQAILGHDVENGVVSKELAGMGFSMEALPRGPGIKFMRSPSGRHVVPELPTEKIMGPPTAEDKLTAAEAGSAPVAEAALAAPIDLPAPALPETVPNVAEVTPLEFES